ncbi:hypothetical protein LTR64_004354 [Lithohypha guttulata]|uniref:uncharacterized protein n=1 Tax=Lithohypha guttulata TaxID=1690604 RepID=UPI002DE172CC|nr:hypothetical protein LTR51_006351 [Lithohypha guttulata]
MTEVSFAKSFLGTLDNKPTKYQPNHIFDPATFGIRIPYTLPKLPTPQHPPPPKPQHDLSQTTTPAPGAEPATSTTNALNIVLKSSRNPAMTLSLPSTPPSTTIASLRQQIQDYLGGSSVVSSTDKIKILHNKKPIPASKQTVGDIVGADAAVKDLELGVMVMGGAPDPAPQDTTAGTTTAIKAHQPEPAGPGSENAAVEAETGLNPEEAITSTAADPMEVDQSTSKGRSESQSQPVQPGEDSGNDVLQTPEFWSDLEGFLAQRIRNQEEASRLRGLFERAWRSSSAAP